MLYPVPFRAEHFFNLSLQPAQMWMRAGTVQPDIATLENPRAVTLMRDATPIICAGAVPLWDERAHIWALVSTEADCRIFRQVHTLAKQFITSLPFRRLEAAVDANFDAGHRWTRALGFAAEGLMRAYQLNGRDSVLYARLGCV